jgi:hypothetical protein
MAIVIQTMKGWFRRHKSRCSAVEFSAFGL